MPPAAPDKVTSNCLERTVGIPRPRSNYHKLGHLISWATLLYIYVGIPICNLQSHVHHQSPRMSTLAALFQLNPNLASSLAHAEDGIVLSETDHVLAFRLGNEAVPL